MAKRIKWGILGTGKIAHVFAQDLLLSDDAVLFAVASRSSGKANAFRKKFNALKSYESYESLAIDPDIDVVYIATPHVFHYKHSMMCMEAGKAVLCEKPFGMNQKQVEKMIQKAKEKQVFLMEAFWTRFIPATEKLQELIQSNRIGTIQMLKADFGFKGDTDPTKRLFNKSLGGGSLLDIGIYPVFLSLYLLGKPDTIEASAVFSSTGIDSSCGILFNYKTGQLSVLDSTFLTNTETEATIYGDKGKIIVHSRFHHSNKLSVYSDDQSIETIEIDYTASGYFHEIEEVNYCLQNNLLESKKMPHAFSLDLILTLDEIRTVIGLAYPSDNLV